MNPIYDAQGWNRKRTDRWMADIPKYAAILTLRKNKSEWKGFVKIDGEKLPATFATSINLTPDVVTDAFYKWAEAYVATFLADKKREKETNGDS